MEPALFAAEHGCNEREARLVLDCLPPPLAAELFVRCRDVPDLPERIKIAAELLRRAMA